MKRQGQLECEDLDHSIPPLPDKVHRQALILRQHNQKPWSDAPGELERAWRYLAQKSDPQLRAKGSDKEDHAVACAFEISKTPRLSLLVRGLVVAGMDASEIAERACLPKEGVELFERIFWNVRPHLDKSVYISLTIKSLDIDQQDILALQFAHSRGADVFLQLLGYQDAQPGTWELLQPTIQLATFLPALSATLRPVESPQDATRAMRTHLGLRKLKMREQKEQQKVQQLLRSVKMAMGSFEQKIGVYTAQLTSDHQRLKERERKLKEREQRLAVREEECGRLMAEAERVIRANRQPQIATPALAALHEKTAATVRKPHRNAS